MKEKIRLDKLLVLNNYAENVNKAKALVMSGKVIVNEKRIDKPGLKFIKEVLIRIKKKNHQWVSRGGIKLDYAIEKMKINVENRVCADLGSSTGGFTDVLLKRKAKHVYCVDVGRGLLDWKIATSNKVTILENTNVRNLTLKNISEKVNLITCDLSFISLTKALKNIILTRKLDIAIIALIKPQFELSKGMIGKNGVVTNNKFRNAAVIKVKSWFYENGWEKQNLIQSPITGLAGNKEYFLYCQK